METLSALLALCGNRSVAVGFPSQRVGTAKFWCFFILACTSCWQTADFPVIWDTMTLVWRHFKSAGLLHKENYRRHWQNWSSIRQKWNKKHDDNYKKVKYSPQVRFMVWWFMMLWLSSAARSSCLSFTHISQVYFTDTGRRNTKDIWRRKLSWISIRIDQI